METCHASLIQRSPLSEGNIKYLILPFCIIATSDLNDFVFSVFFRSFVRIRTNSPIRLKKKGYFFLLHYRTLVNEFGGLHVVYR